MRVVTSLFLSFSLSLGILSCGNSDSMSMTDTFRATDNVTDSIFGQGVVTGDFRLKVISTGVSSGFVKLNDEQLLGPSDFHNQSFEVTLPVGLFLENTIEFEIRGKPGDQLCVRVFEVETDDSERGIYEGCVDRTAGPPNNVEVVIAFTPTPTATPN